MPRENPMSSKTMKSNPHKPRSGFSLVELMVVIAIMAILATLGVGSFAFIQERQAREKAKVQIALLSKAIEEYKLDMGAYPGATADFGGELADDIEGDSSQVLYAALFKEGFDYTNPATPPTNWENKATKIYVPELDIATSKLKWVKEVDDKIVIIDPWRGNYRYRVGTNAESPDFDLWSMGKDKKTDTSNSAMTQEDNKDDIRNF